jgi:hypothetical protein
MAPEQEDERKGSVKNQLEIFRVCSYVVNHDFIVRTRRKLGRSRPPAMGRPLAWSDENELVRSDAWSSCSILTIPWGRPAAYASPTRQTARACIPNGI